VPALPQELIRTKRDGGRLTGDEIRAFIGGITDGSIPDYQAAAMLMAVFLRGLDDDEMATWCDAMVHSGDVLDLSEVTRPRIDKHSTGGVGDKISLPLAPAAAACGLAVPMVSGRGLGHTGGTLDKLEAIPGFRVDLDVDRFALQVAELGVCLMGQTERMAPADRVLYALRDVTSTVESIPLIASSIMSKKLAEGIDGLVLDCKVGTGAFMKTRERATELARAIQGIGRAAGKQVTVVLTRMDEPIGDMVGNALEVAESVAILQGNGTADTRALTVELGAEMLLLGGICESASSSRPRAATHASPTTRPACWCAPRGTPLCPRRHPVTSPPAPPTRSASRPSCSAQDAAARRTPSTRASASRWHAGSATPSKPANRWRTLSIRTKASTTRGDASRAPTPSAMSRQRRAS